MCTRSFGSTAARRLAACRAYVVVSTATFVMASATSVSPAQADGGQIAYVGSDSHSVHLVQADGSSDRQLFNTETTYVFSPRWSPDGKFLAYTTTNPPSIRRESQRIFLYDTTTQRTTEVKSSIGTYGPIAFYPDGKRLAAAGGTGPSAVCGGGLVSIDLGSGVATPLLTLGGCPFSLQVAPDGTTLITATANEDQSTFNVQEWSLMTGQARSLADPNADVFEVSAAVTPDNQAMVYIARPSDDPIAQGNLVLANRDGSKSRVIWEGVPGEQLNGVAVAADSTQLATTLAKQTSDGDLAYEIWVMGVDGSNPHKSADGSGPAWRPNPGHAMSP